MRFLTADPVAAEMVAAFTARCTYPFEKVATNVVMPVAVSDLTRYLRPSAVAVRGAVGPYGSAFEAGEPVDALPDVGHAHFHSPDGEEGHGIIFRGAVWGLYWLPTATYPAGRIEVERTLSAVNREIVFGKEAWHGIQYTVLDASDEETILIAYHGGQHWTAVGHVRDYFEEAGELDYVDWVGESGMVGFIRATSDYVVSDYFSHKSTPEVVATLRTVLWRHVPVEPTPEPTPEPVEPQVGIKCRRLRCRNARHRPTCRFAKLIPLPVVPLTSEEIASRRPCRICKPA